MLEHPDALPAAAPTDAPAAAAPADDTGDASRDENDDGDGAASVPPPATPGEAKKRHARTPPPATPGGANKRRARVRGEVEQGVPLAKGAQVSVVLDGKRWEGQVEQVLKGGKLDIYFAADHSIVKLDAARVVPLRA